MAKITFERFAEMLDEVINRIPPRYLHGLNGGFNLKEGKKREGGYLIMGEYIESDVLGSIIMFYYGSFVELLRNEPLEVWEEEITETVLHELQHHLEAMAGRDDLAREEMEELAKALQKEK